MFMHIININIIIVLVMGLSVLSEILIIAASKTKIIFVYF